MRNVIIRNVFEIYKEVSFLSLINLCISQFVHH
jgi:hypothetical protein